MTNFFSTDKRSIELYDKMKVQYEKKDIANLIETLPRFTRLALIENDKSVTWLKTINKFDLLFAMPVNLSFGKLDSNIRNAKYCSQIQAYQAKTQFVSPSYFLNDKKIIVFQENEYSIQDFILSIGYNGLFHASPDPDKKELKELYNGFIETNPEVCADILLQISHVFIEAFRNIRAKFSGNNDPYSDINDKQPLALKDGQPVTFPNGEPAIEFNDSYMQAPLPNRKKGLRICFDLQLFENSQNGALISIGHRKKPEDIAVIRKNGRSIVIRFRGKTIVLKLVNYPEILQARNAFELCIYPDGGVVVSLNAKAINRIKTDKPFSIGDGKVMVGNTLDGACGAHFINSFSLVQAIDENNNVERLLSSGLTHFRGIIDHKLDYNTDKRPIGLY